MYRTTTDSSRTSVAKSPLSPAHETLLRANYRRRTRIGGEVVEIFVNAGGKAILKQMNGCMEVLLVSFGSPYVNFGFSVYVLLLDFIFLLLVIRLGRWRISRIQIVLDCALC